MVTNRPVCPIVSITKNISRPPFAGATNDTYRWWTHIVVIRIRELRSTKGMTQEDLAELSGLSRQYIGDVERGARNISLIRNL
ncbi:MAG: helix-turn-helix transcriptional regulator [Deltaproteobacteria bacterium]|nr:helix-turn-helix transcriptional regulator [Deltaproteobacteria bacterium]